MTQTDSKKTDAPKVDAPEEISPEQAQGKNRFRVIGQKSALWYEGQQGEKEFDDDDAYQKHNRTGSDDNVIAVNGGSAFSLDNLDVFGHGAGRSP